MSQHNFHILVLEDSADWVDKLTSYLEGYRVTVARTLSEAFGHLQGDPFDLAIVDISLVTDDPTDEEGLRFVSALRETSFLRDTKIIIVTAYHSSERIRLAFHHYDVFDFLDKGSLTPQSFRKVVAEALGTEQPAK
jgi:two-component system response regulator PilR (NtrC family)